MKVEVNTPRYNVGDSALVIYIDYRAESRRPFNMFIPWEDKLNKIDLRYLNCEEHHRVPGMFDDVPRYDGFVFYEEGNNHQWFNQYPRSAWSEGSKDTDYYFSPASPEADPYPGKIAFFQDALKYLEKIDALRQSDQLEEWPKEALKQFQDQIVAEIYQKYRKHVATLEFGTNGMSRKFALIDSNELKQNLFKEKPSDASR